MAELERLANHIGDIGAICNDASFSLMQAHASILRERVLRASRLCFGHRLMMDRIVPGGVVDDLTMEGVVALHALLSGAKKIIPRFIDLYGDTTSIQDRTVGAGFLGPELVKQYACGGVIGRASGRGFDARRTPGYAPYPRRRRAYRGLSRRHFRLGEIGRLGRRAALSFARSVVVSMAAARSGDRGKYRRGFSALQ